MSHAKLGSVDPKSLVEARLVVHWAAQLPSAAGTSRIAPRDDFSHTNLGYDHALGALVTHDLGDGWVAGLQLRALELLVAREGEVQDRLPLAGKTLAEGEAWLAATLDARLGDTVALARPEHSMPAHGVGDGAPFPAPEGPAFADVAEWFHLAHHLLTEIASHNRDRAPLPRCWPHHFDIATLITVEPHEDAEKAKSVGVGMTPGDEGYPEPYLYVTPWPYPDAASLPPLPTGHWHTEGWTGAVLLATDLTAAADPVDAARSFLQAATAATLTLIA